MTFEEYQALTPDTNVYSFSIYKREGIIGYGSINSVIECDIICEPYYKQPTLGYSFQSDTMHLCISEDTHQFYFLSEAQALFWKTMAIMNSYDTADKSTQEKIKKFYRQKKISPIISKDYPELLI